MSLNSWIYFSRRRLNAFFPDQAPWLTPSWKVGVNLQVLSVEIGSGNPLTPTEEESRKLAKVRKSLEREVSHFHAPLLNTGDWVYFDLEMGWGTSYEDSDMPDIDDVLLFCGSLPGDPTGSTDTVDLMLCGSTEHLLDKTATAGRMGSGSRWLHDLILKINRSDGMGITGVPEELTHRALSKPRINQPEQIARDVFRIAQRHHNPLNRGRVQGLACVDLNLPNGEWSSRLIMATPLYVQRSSQPNMRWITRFRMHRDICRRYGRSPWKWRPDLPPRDRGRTYDPASNRMG